MKFFTNSSLRYLRREDLRQSLQPFSSYAISSSRRFATTASTPPCSIPRATNSIPPRTKRSPACGTLLTSVAGAASPSELSSSYSSSYSAGVKMPVKANIAAASALFLLSSGLVLVAISSQSDSIAVKILLFIRLYLLKNFRMYLLTFAAPQKAGL